LAGKLGQNLKSFNIVVFMQLAENILEEKWGPIPYLRRQNGEKERKVKFLNFDFCCNCAFRILEAYKYGFTVCRPPGFSRGLTI
jgi:hypothetical protein